MIVAIQLFGPFREFHAAAELQLDCAGAHSIGDVRAALDAHALAHWPDYRSALLRTSAFASSTCVLRDAHPIPPDRRVAILPPVSGG
jgi:molybdopterin converting factor small subunit